MTAPPAGPVFEREPHAALDVSGLPETGYGPGDLPWWGTLGFVTIEGFTLLLCAVIWIYLAQGNPQWPPYGVARPSLVVPTLLAVGMLASLWFVRRLRQAARAKQYLPTRRLLTTGAVLSTVFLLGRILELAYALNVRWDANAYGSAQWLVIATHGTLLVMQWIEVSGVALAFWFADLEIKHFADADDLGFYWIFMVLSWIPLYGLCFLGPYLTTI